MPTVLSPPRKNRSVIQMPGRKRWIRSECENLERSGFLPEHYELINGEIYEKITVNPPHSIALILLSAWMEQQFGRMHVRTQDPILLPDIESKPEPDLVVMHQPVTSYILQHPGPDDLLLLAEVSDTTLAFDLKDKSILYARAKISEYWVLDIVGRRIVVHLDPSPIGYQNVASYSESELVVPFSHPTSSLLVRDVLPPV